MKLSFAPAVALGVISTLLLGALPQKARAASGTVVIVAEGLSPQVLELSKSYLRRADEDAELTTSFDFLKQNAKTATVSANALGQLSGLLQSAHDNGYATGLVTTGDVTKIAPLFYKLQDDVAAGLTTKDAPYEFIAGGGADNLVGAADKMATNDDTFVASSNGMYAELKGRVLVAEAPADLSYSLDRNPAQESGLSELATTAIDTLSSNEKPFLLVIHDSLIAKAVKSHDTPALFEQFRELNTVIGDTIMRRDEDANLKVAVLMTEASVIPTFTTQSLDEQNAAYSIIAHLNQSFTFAGQSLKGKTAEDITAFIEPESGEYRDWRLTAADKTKIANGTLAPETALRAFYEPTLKLNYAAKPSVASAFIVGFDAPDGLVAALKALATTPTA
ncbi:hypothetical protein EON83_09030 [bacterium]|nr:MAG: hypothetical protein EON83_09030 [bacterium]